jgi:hypothetical protein
LEFGNARRHGHNQEQMSRALEAVAHLMKSKGLFILGWDKLLSLARSIP